MKWLGLAVATQNFCNKTGSLFILGKPGKATRTCPVCGNSIEKDVSARNMVTCVAGYAEYDQDIGVA